MDGLTKPRELRRAMRVRSKGSIRLHHRAGVVRGRLLDLGAGGANLRIEPPHGLTALVGARVRLDVNLDARHADSFSLQGHGLRSVAAAKAIVIEFDHVPTEFEDCVQDELLAALEYGEALHVILVDPNPSRRGQLADAFRGAGCHVTSVATPLEAIARLDRWQFEPDVIAIADTSPSAMAEGLREYVFGEHPEAHLIAIGESGLDRDPAESWLSWTDTSDDLGSRVAGLIGAYHARYRASVSRLLASPLGGPGTRGTPRARLDR